MARRIVKKFGEKTLDVIESDAGKLTQVEGIGTKRIEMIKRTWADQKEIREVMVFLQSHGVSSGYATKIFKQYGNESIKVVKENPYRLATDIFGIGFITADKIAEKLGFEKESELRAQAGILYVLHELFDEGHVFYPCEPLIEKCNEILEIDREVAYAVSVHKAQGSQYPVVVIPVHTQHYVLLQRNFIYTGITRGRKPVVLVGTRKALAIAVRNNKTQKRYTRLRERLMGDSQILERFRKE